jgi:serine/threonine-protein kinase TNNI3K
VRFVDVAWKYHNDLQALFEYMELGDLRQYLQSTERSQSRQWDDTKFRIASDVIEALVFVHLFVPPVVHRDIKSRNILLGAEDDAIRVKLTDFGTARSESGEADT